MKSRISELEAQIISDPSSTVTLQNMSVVADEKTEIKTRKFHQKVDDRKSCGNFSPQFDVCNKNTPNSFLNTKVINNYNGKDQQCA